MRPTIPPQESSEILMINPEDIPTGAEIATVVDAVSEFANRLPPDDQTLEVTGWTDGDLQVHLVHNMGRREREFVLYDSDRDEIHYTHVRDEGVDGDELQMEVLEREVLAENVLGE